MLQSCRSQHFSSLPPTPMISESTYISTNMYAMFSKVHSFFNLRRLLSFFIDIFVNIFLIVLFVCCTHINTRNQCFGGNRNKQEKMTFLSPFKNGVTCKFQTTFSVWLHSRESGFRIQTVTQFLYSYLISLKSYLFQSGYKQPA